MYSMYYTFDNNLSFVYPSINWCMFTHIPSSITYHLQTSNMTCWSFSWLIMWTGQEKKDSLICICEVSVMTCFYSVTYSDLSSLELLKVSLLPLSTPHLVTVISSHHLWLFYSNHHFTSVRPSSASPSFPQHFITSTLLQLFLSLLLCLLESSFLYLGCFLSCLFVSFTHEDITSFTPCLQCHQHFSSQGSLRPYFHPQCHSGNTYVSWGGLSEWSAGGKPGKHRVSPQYGRGCVAWGGRERKIFCNTRDRCMVVPSHEEQEQEPGTPEGDK